jgi:predicted Zn-dependent protease
MFRNTALAVSGAFLLLVLAGCSLQQPKLSAQKKAFPEEDTYALFALDAQAQGHYATAAKYFATLYNKAPRVEYRDRFFQNLLMAKEYDTVLTNADDFLKNEGFNAQVERYRIQALVGKDQLAEAETAALALLKKTKAKQDYIAVADIYAMQKQYNTALRYLESAYDIDYDEAVLDRMAVMMYVNLDRKKDAIALLETHSRMYGCSERICKRLASFYSEQNNIDGMLSTYLRLYDAEPSKQTADAIVRIYSYQNDTIALQQFLKRNHTDDKLLLKLYINAKAYADASVLAQKLYEQSGEAEYLGQSAIFAFEADKDKKDPKLLASVVSKLKTAVRSDPDPLLLNYLGYLLIDNDLNVKEGIAYVEAALKKEPDSPYYLDSLAWGYYKLGQCKRADTVMKKVVKAMEGEKDEELDKHIEAIRKCLKKR